MFKTFQYRLKPNKNNITQFEAIFEQDRKIYNDALRARRDAYKNNGVSIDLYDQQKFLTKIRKGGLKGHCVRQREALKRLDKAFKAFFRRVREMKKEKKKKKVGYPRFKTRDRWNSIEIPSQYRIKDGKFISNDFKDGLGIKFHRPLPDNLIKHCGATILRKAGKWFINFRIEIPTPEKKSINSHIGIDVGLDSFLTTSDGRKVDNPKHFRKAQKNLRQKQRFLSRAKIGSKSRQKKKLMVQRAHIKIADQRRDFHHKTSKDLVSRYNAVSAEKLNIEGMKGNKRLSKSLSDAGWGLFLRMIAYKAESAGLHFIQVNPKGTSQNCSTCGEKVPKDLTVRTHECPSCGLVCDRDLNAAINIRRLGQSLLPLSHIRPVSTGSGSDSPSWGYGTEYTLTQQSC